MKKIKSLSIIILIFVISTSCADDNDFHSLIGEWENPPKSGNPVLMSSSEITSDDCEPPIYISFEKNLTGELQISSSCDGNYELVSFDWGIKGDELTIIFDSNSDNIWESVSGNNSFYIKGDRLTIINEDGTISLLSKIIPVN